MHDIGDIIMTAAIVLPFGYREVPWSVCQDAYRADPMAHIRCAVYDPKRELVLPEMPEIVLPQMTR